MDYELIIRLFLALLFGAVLGFEREYRSKAAGFRTITLICIGSALFTITSFKLGYPGNMDRIASNIITGIGFIGAGVVFKDGGFVTGLTTAATIWIAAAMGMALGNGEYMVASTTLVFSMIVLSVFERVQDWIDAIHQEKAYRISFHANYEKAKAQVESQLTEMKLQYRIKKCVRTSDDVSVYYNLSGNQNQMDRFTAFLLDFKEVKSFDE